MDNEEVSDRRVFDVNDGDLVFIDNKRSFKEQTFCLLSQSMTRYGDEITDRTYGACLNRNKKAVWLMANALVIAGHQFPQKNMIHVRYGDLLHVREGRTEEQGLWEVCPPGPYGGDDARLVRWPHGNKH